MKLLFRVLLLFLPITAFAQPGSVNLDPRVSWIINRYYAGKYSAGNCSSHYEYELRGPNIIGTYRINSNIMSEQSGKIEDITIISFEETRQIWRRKYRSKALNRPEVEIESVHLGLNAYSELIESFTDGRQIFKDGVSVSSGARALKQSNCDKGEITTSGPPADLLSVGTSKSISERERLALELDAERRKRRALEAEIQLNRRNESMVAGTSQADSKGQNQEAQDRCTGYGFTAGTPPFAQCVMQIDLAQRNAAIKQQQLNSQRAQLEQQCRAVYLQTFSRPSSTGNAFEAMQAAESAKNRCLAGLPPVEQINVVCNRIGVNQVRCISQ